MPATAPKKPAATAKPASQVQRVRDYDVLDDIADAQENRLDIVHRALFAEAGGQPLPPNAASILPILGDDKDVKRARRDASCGYSAVAEFKRTADAEKLAAQARDKRDKESPAIRDQIVQLQQQLAALEQAPLQHERDAQAHVAALERVRSHAPAFIKARRLQADAISIAPLRERWAQLKGEASQLRGLLIAAEEGLGHVIRSARDRNGQQPWILRDMHDREVTDPSAWAAFLRDERVQQRHDQLQQQVEELEQQIAAAEAEGAKMLDYWLEADSEGD